MGDDDVFYWFFQKQPGNTCLLGEAVEEEKCSLCCTVMRDGANARFIIVVDLHVVAYVQDVCTLPPRESRAPHMWFVHECRGHPMSN